MATYRDFLRNLKPTTAGNLNSYIVEVLMIFSWNFVFIKYKHINQLTSFYFAESSRVVDSWKETKRLSSAWCE